MVLKRTWSTPILLLTVVAAIALTTRDANGQEGTRQGAISGVVVQARNGASLPGANVRIQGTTTGTSTDLKGRYTIGGLEPGSYDIQFTFVGYQSKTVAGVEVNAGETTTLDVSLAEKTAELEEIVVEAEAARNTQAGLLTKRSKAASMTDAISAETIGESGSSTAADAIQKVTGASVTDGKFVNVRGLGGRYVNTQLNGSDLPSANPNKNSVPLDLFPGGLLDNIVTSKSFTPDKPGSYTGGNVNLTTKSFPTERTFSVSTSGTYNSEVQFDSILRQSGGLRKVPGIIPALPEGELTAGNQPIPPYFGADVETKQFLDDVTNAFSVGKVDPESGSAPMNQSHSVSFGDEFEVLGGRPLGVVAGATYSRSAKASRDRLSASAGPESAEGVTPDFHFTGQSGSTEEVIGGIANLSFKPHPNHEISLNSLYNRSSQTSSVFLSGTIPRDDDTRLFNRRRVEPIDRTVWNVQGKGEHLLGSGRGSPRLTWSSSYANTIQDESDVRFFTDDYLPERDVHRIATSIYEFPTRYFRELDEYTWTNEMSVSVPIGSGHLKAGGTYLFKQRNLDERRFIYDNLGSPNYEGRPDIYFSECIGIIEEGECDEGPYSDAPRPDLGVVIQEQTSAQNNLIGDRTVGAGYAMVDSDVPGISSLRFVGGLRVEYTDQFLETRDNQSGQIEETDLLPSANLIYSIREDMNLRAAYGRTLARPTFREFSPATYYDFKRQEIVDGNPHLQRTLVNNFDVRWEWFAGPGELFAVSGYYKSFGQPIERVVQELAINREVTYENQQSARVYGAEFEARTDLGFVADAVRHLEVGGNLTFTESAVTDTSGQDLGRPLEGQSPFLVNADVSYDNPESGTTVSLYYNYFDDRLDTIERENQPDQYERGRHTLDLVASQELLYGVQVKASIKNVLNQKTEIFQEFQSEEFTTVQYRQGRTFSLGITYNL